MLSVQSTICVLGGVGLASLDCGLSSPPGYVSFLLACVCQCVCGCYLHSSHLVHIPYVCSRATPFLVVSMDEANRLTKVCLSVCAWACACLPRVLALLRFSVSWPCRAVPCRAVPCRAVPCRAVPCRTVTCRAVGPAFSRWLVQ